MINDIDCFLFIYSRYFSTERSKARKDVTNLQLGYYNFPIVQKVVPASNPFTLR